MKKLSDVLMNPEGTIAKYGQGLSADIIEIMIENPSLAHDMQMQIDGKNVIQDDDGVDKYFLLKGDGIGETLVPMKDKLVRGGMYCNFEVYTENVKGFPLMRLRKTEKQITYQQGDWITDFTKDGGKK